MSRSALPSALAVGAVVVAVLAGCAPETPAASTSPSPSTSVSPSSSPDPSPSASASASAPATTGGDPLDETCLDLVSLQTMYDFDPNFSLDDSYSPAAGSLAATAVADAGLACSWVQQTSGETIVISVAEPNDLAARAGAAGITGQGSAFSASGDVGTVQVIDDDYWVTLTSTYFGSVADAQPLIDSIVDELD